MKHNRTIIISEHAIDRFIERFEFAGKNSDLRSAVRVAAERAIQEMWKGANYISDDPKGVLFRANDFHCDFIVSKKVMVTLFPTRPKIKQPGNESTTDLTVAANGRGNSHNSRFRKGAR